eukprot:CAMPEP_0119053314 /NCGR_PEP_ID=MMETSP1177-20130426/74352_1 /TAXON_ID=2985 /ORGANISM="Ochromonas sp, Strain CCMP1899" /LENGTH=588 /DNA_ID=CAMNT_0007033237 /DNA_START=507 /DNA_END=2274 /DNA_ORIENTATION=-
MVLEIETHLMAVKEDGIPSSIPSGILDYLTPYDAPLNMPLLREYLLSKEDQWFNAGAVLRWNVGLSVMEAYSAISEGKVLSFTQSWVKDVKKMVISPTPSTQPSLNPLQPSLNPHSYLTLLEVTEGLLEGNMIGDTNTIISMGVNIEEQNDAGGLNLRPLTFDEMKVYHLRMTQELHIPEELKLEARQLKALKTKIMLGQPVKIADETPQTVSTIVRIALGADMVVKAFTDESGYDDYEDQLVVEKMQCLAQYWHLVSITPVPMVTPVLTATVPSVIDTPVSTASSVHVASFDPNLKPLSSSCAEPYGPDRDLLSHMNSIDRDFKGDGILHKGFEQDSARTCTTAAIVSEALKCMQKQEQLAEVIVLYDVDALSNCFRGVTEDFLTASSHVCRSITTPTSPLTPPNTTPLSSQTPAMNETTTSSVLNTDLNDINLKEENNEFLHCFAVKSCPLSYVLHSAVQEGLGLECASIMEVKQALRCGCDSSKVVFDSPCKTVEELHFSLTLGVHININSLGELEKIKNILKSLHEKGLSSTSSIGLRLNPLIGSGAIAALSTATETSKFGVPLAPLSSKEIEDEDVKNGGKEL